MRRAIWLLPLALFLCSCAPHSPIPRSPGDAVLFAPVSMRIHPIFSQIKDWTGDDRPDGIEALLEFEDQFGDPTKASGTVIFELYSYQRGDADVRGDRLCNPWVGSLLTLADQQARWNRTSRTYFFQLEYPMIKDDRPYVLCATFDTGTTRFFDQIVIQGPNTPRLPREPSTQSTQPSTRRSATRNATTGPQPGWRAPATTTTTTSTGATTTTTMPGVPDVPPSF